MSELLLTNAFDLGVNLATLYQLYEIKFTNPSVFDSEVQTVLDSLVDETQHLLAYFSISTDVLNHITGASSFDVLVSALPQVLRQCKYPIKVNFGENVVCPLELGLSAATYPKLRTSGDTDAIRNLVETIRSDAQILGIPIEVINEFLARPKETILRLKRSIGLLSQEVAFDKTKLIPGQARQTTSELPSTHPQAGVAKQLRMRFSVNDTPDRFRDWFYRYTTSEEGVRVCSVDGQNVYFGFDGHSTRMILKIEGYRVAGKEHVRIAEPWLIRFTLTDHGNRVTVLAEHLDLSDAALEVEVSRYFVHLLTAVADEYPEARETVFSHLRLPGAATESAPSRIPLDPPKAGWNIVVHSTTEEKQLAADNACVFVGAGLSVGAGLPSWYDLIAELSARIGHELPPAKWATGDALIDAAQAYVNRQGLHSLISHLKDRLDTTGVQPTAAHRALARLPISLVFTANFDNLLERAFREAGKRVEVVVKDSSIPFMRRGPDTVNIVKLYGDLDQPDTIVLARQQYESYFLQRPQMVKLLEAELARSDMLYLGWSGSDPYFKLVFGELLSRFGPMMRPGYAVMFDVTDDQRDELRRKQIRLVELPAGDRTASLAKWLENLVPSSAPAGPTGGKGDGPPSGAPQTVLNTGKTWAVLVGVNQYENQPHIPSLHVCVEDVTAVHAALSGKYTAARLLTDDTPERLPTRANILGELSSVAQAAAEGDLLLFYFSGHGIAEGGESYLLPRDARLAALKHTAIAMKDVREIIEASPARAKVIVLDACHSGAAIGKAAAMTPEFIQRVFTEAEGMAVLASCKQGQQSWEWPEKGRSVFTHFLLEALSGKADFDGKGLVTVSDASRYVTDGVKAWGVEHGVPQTPTLQYTVAGDIVLLKV